GRRLWLWPVIAAVVLAGVGWCVHLSMEHAMRKQVAGGLKTILDADVTSMRTWMKEQEYNAQILAGDDPVLPAAQELLKLESKSKSLKPDLMASPALQKLRKHLGHRLRIIGYTDFFLVSPTNRILAAGEDDAVGRELTHYRK